MFGSDANFLNFAIMRLNSMLIYIASLLFFGSVSSFAAGDDYGLLFKSHMFPQDERTSLDITPVEPFDCSGEFVLEFDILSRWEEYAYGYVFRLIGDDAVCLDMLSNYGWKKVDLVLSKDHVLLEKKSVDNVGKFYSGEYSHVRINVSADRTISCNIDGESFLLKEKFPVCNRLNVFFGATHHPLFGTNDVPPFTLRDVIVRDSDSRLYHWKLAGHIGDTVLDELRLAGAQAVNAEWLVDRGYRWNRRFTRKLRLRHPQIASDPSADRVILALPDSVLVFDIGKGKVAASANSVNHPICECGSQMYFDPRKNELCCFSLNSNALSHFDFDSSAWDHTLVETWPQKSGHSVFLDASGRKQYIFGGYSNHNYSSNLLVRDLDSGAVSEKNFAGFVSPRYFSMVTVLPDGRIFVAGGHGSLTGSQADVPFNAYDSYYIDYDSGTVELGPKLKMPDDTPAVFAGQGIVHEADPQHVYALSFNNNRSRTELQLLRISIADGFAEKLSSPIPYLFSDINSLAELSFSRDSSQVFAYVLNPERDDSYSLDIYTLSFPPVPESSTLQAVPDKDRNWLYFLLVLLAAVVASVLPVIVVERRRSRKTDRLLDALITQTTQNSEHRKYDIALLGGLQILNSSAEEITSSFQPMLRKMLCLFVIGSSRDNKGLTSDYVDELLWPGMDKASASNNRNVNIRKLRVLLSEMKNVSLVYSKDIWTLVMGEDVRCDYVEISRLMQINDFSKVTDVALIEELTRLASRGALLSDMTGEWVDQLKSNYVQKLDRALTDATKNPLCAEDPVLMLRVIDAMLVQDSLDEDSIKLKCRTLYRLGRKAYAHKVFENFATEYEHAMGGLPDFNFADCLKN